MRYGLFAIAAGLLTIGAATAQAQTLSSQYLQKCPAGASASSNERITQDACVKAIDIFKFVAPQLATAVAGGNAVLGSGSTLGGIGHISFGLRVNAVAGDLPRVDRTPLSTGGAVSSTFETKRQLIPLPVADVALGVFGGIPLGITNVGAVDAIISASYLPEFDGGNVSVKLPGGSIQLGYGARIGLIQESFVLPGVSVSWLRRDLPTVTLTARSQANDTLTVDDFDVETSAWRIVASKSFLMFGLAVGGGRDTYDFSADVNAVVQPTLFTGRQTRSVTGIETDMATLKRTTYFADLSMNLPFFRLVGEIGQVSGGDIDTFNRFGEAADKSRVYGSIGIRLGW